MNPRRILIVTNRIPYPLHDGGALAMDAMIRGYRDAGLQVHVLAMNTIRHFIPQEKVASLYHDIQGFDAVRFDNGLKPLKLLANILFSKKPEHAQRFYSSEFEAKLVAVIQAFQPDIVQMESPFLSEYLPVIKQYSKAMLVLRMHNVEYQVWERLAAESTGWKKNYLGILARRMRVYEEEIWKQYDLLLPITDADAQMVRQLDTQLPLQVAPFGIAIHAAGGDEQYDFTKAYHVGAMDWLPNAAAIDWLLQEIWPEVKRMVPQATFYFAGRHMPERYYQQLPEGAFCAGEVPSVTQFKKGKSVLFVPLRSGGGIRVKILEAMAAGKLVISTSVGMQGINAVPGVHYLKADTPLEFATAMHWCNQYPDLAVQMIAAARQMIAGHYNLDTITKAIIERF